MQKKVIYFEADPDLDPSIRTLDSDPDLDLDPDPALFVSGFQDAYKILVFSMFFAY